MVCITQYIANILARTEAVCVINGIDRRNNNLLKRFSSGYIDFKLSARE